MERRSFGEFLLLPSQLLSYKINCYNERGRLIHLFVFLLRFLRSIAHYSGDGSVTARQGSYIFFFA